MREEVLRKFFEGNATATELAKDVRNSTEHLSKVESAVSIEDMDDEFNVTSEMAVRLCDAVLSGQLRANDLAAIGFALMASDQFCWDGEQDDVLAEVIADWSAPEINYPLTLENVQQFRSWLTREKPYPAKPESNTNDFGGSVVSVIAKRQRRPC